MKKIIDFGIHNGLWKQSWFLLVAGVVLLPLSDNRGGTDFLAWFAMVPFLLYVMNYHGGKKSVWLFFSLQLAVHLMIAKIITPPLSYLMVSMFAIPTAVALWFFLTLWSKLYRRTPLHLSIFLYVAIVVLMEWLQSFESEMGVWGTLANTQLQNLPLLQLASLTGALGISALLAWSNALIAQIIQQRGFGKFRVHGLLFLAVLTAVHIYGNLRLLGTQKGDALRVAAVSTNYIPAAGGLPDTADPAIVQERDSLFAKSERAAKMGAKVVVWNEGATIVSKQSEKEFLERAAAFTQSTESYLVAAYVVPLRKDPVSFENKYVLITPDGKAAEEYLKHHPGPGEGSVQGTEPLRTTDTPYGKISGAICYDYDFPEMSLKHARLGTDLLLLPSSDWRGIDPQHTLMSRVRAIEGGFSLLRSVRAATSMGFDAYGRIRGSLPYYEKNDRILLVSLPMGRISTIYSRTGDLLPFPAILLLIAGLTIALKSWRGEKAEGPSKNRQDHE